MVKALSLRRLLRAAAPLVGLLLLGCPSPERYAPLEVHLQSRSVSPRGPGWDLEGGSGCVALGYGPICQSLFAVGVRVESSPAWVRERALVGLQAALAEGGERVLLGPDNGGPELDGGSVLWWGTTCLPLPEEEEPELWIEASVIDPEGEFTSKATSLRVPTCRMGG